MQECVFCAILAGELPARMVWEDAQVVAFMDLRQAVPGHVLVVPRQHAETLYALDEALAGQVMRVAHRVARALRDTLAPDGLNLWQSNGEAGGQEVPHFHLHVQPRRHGDGLLDVYPMGVPVPSTMAQLEPLATRLRNALGGGSQQVPAPQHAAQ